MSGEFYLESFDGGTNGVAPTVSGDITGVTATTLYSSADAVHGAMGVRTSVATGAGLKFAKSTLTNSHTGSIYVIARTLSAGANRFLMFQSTASAACASLRMNFSTGKFDIANSASTTITSSTTSWVLNHTYRIDWQFDGSVSGQYAITMRIFSTNYEGTVADETITGTSTTATVFGQFLVGSPGNVANVVGFDTLRIYDTTGSWPAPFNPGGGPPPPPPAPGTVNFLWVGGATASSLSVTSSTSAASSLTCKASTASDMSAVVFTSGAVVPNTLTGMSKFDLTGLSSNTQYYYQITDTPTGGSPGVIGEIGKAKTLPPSGSAQNFTFAFGGCVTNNADAHVVFDDLRTSYTPNFFIHMGDFHYQNPTSTIATDHVALWQSQIAGVNGYHNLLRDIPSFYIRSDHDAGPGDNMDSNNASNQASINGYKQVVPFPASGYLADTRSPTVGLYFTFVVGRIRFIFVDIRNMDRSPGLNTDNSSKTMLGAVQKTWLKAQLVQSEPVKIIVSDVAWSGPPSTSNGEDKWWSYSTERIEIANYIATNNVKAIMLTSDTHSLLCDDGTNNTWGAFPIFGAAPFANVGGGRNLGFYQGLYNTTSSVVGNQYGRVAVTDNGTTITLAYGGYDAVHSLVQITKTITFSAAGVVLHFTQWDGTTEQPLTLTIWNGTTEVAGSVSGVNTNVGNVFASNTYVDNIYYRD